MKKRLLSLVLCLVMVFSLMPLSAMAKVYPVGDTTSMLEIKFFKGDTEINSQRIAEDSVSIYDPGCPVEGQEVFRGWKIQGQNDMLPVKAAEGEPSITAYVEQNYDDIESPLRVNAVMSHVRYLVYMDNKDRVLKTDFAREEDGYKTAVDFDYVPTAANEDLFGWATSKNATAASYHNGDEITLDKDKVELYPVCKAGYWLSFDNNLEKQAAPINQDDTRATFTAPRLYFTGDPTQEPTAPTRPGYRLEGWYTDENLTQKYTFGQTLSDDLTLYAKWVPSGTVNYQVIIWKQKTTDDPNAGDDAKTYDYAADPSVTRWVPAGSTVSITSDDTGLVREANASNNYRNISMGTTEKWNFFQYNSAKSDISTVIVKGDGSTVLNVYYDRKPITFNFYASMEQKTRDLSSWGTNYWRSSYAHFGLVNGEYVLLNLASTYAGYPDSDGDVPTEYAKWTVASTGANYSGNIYRLSDSDNVWKSYTGLYGAKFDNWPTGVVWETKYSYPMALLMYDNADYDIEEAYANMPTTMNFHYSGNPSGHDVHYLGQTVDGEDYEELISFKSSGDWSPTEKIVGFTIKEWRNGTSGDWTPITESGSADISEEAYFRFTRNQHEFELYSNGSIINAGNTTLYYETPLNVYGTSDYIPTNGDAGTYFDGWYADPGFTTPFDFNTTMPDNDVRVYAKWTTMRFRVVLDPINGEEGVQPSDINFGGNQVTTFRLDYGEKIGKNAIATATREGYQLVGWYSDPNYKHPFNFGFATWDQIADFDYDTATDEERSGTDPWNIENGQPKPYSDVGEDDVVGKVVIYAKWRHVMGDNEYLTVAYDADPGTLATQDTNKYADMASAIALPAPQAPAGFTFSYWQVMKPTSDTDTTLIPSSVTVAPGNTYDVRLADAVNGVVTLKAVYAKSDTATHITWFGNGGVTAENAGVKTTNTEVNLPTNILSADTFTRPGYAFLGWARVEESNFQEGNSWRQSDGTDVTDHLFLIWNESEQKFYVNHNEDSSLSTTEDVAVTQIAANEIQPYHVLYAVWEKNECHTYVIDFSAPMKVAERADKIKGATDNVLQGSNGKFVKTGTDVTYQLDTQQLSGKNVRINKAYNAVDEATVHGVLMNVAGDKLGWKEITTIPAGSIYFDDDLAAAIDVGDGSGYNEDISATPAAQNTAAGTYTFTFYGTGIDVYCTTAPDGGMIQAKVDGGKTNGQADLNKVQSVRNYDKEVTRYNVPTISFRNLGQGEHTLELRVMSSSNYKLDGIRVYNPVANSTYEGQGTHEQYATFINMREALVNDNGVSQAFTDSMTEAVLGALFIDDSSKLNTEQPSMKWDPDADEGAGAWVPDLNEDGTQKTVHVYESKFEAYKENSPKHEIYLKNNQAITFVLTADAVTAAASGNLWIGLSAPDAGKQSGTVEFKAGVTQTISTAVDEYYPITTDRIGANRTVTITNTGTNMISVTNLKITGNQTIYNAANTPKAGTESVSEDAVILSVEDVVPMVFEPVTMQTVKIAANDGVDPDAPVVEPDDPTPTPGISELIRQLISNFVSYLFQSVARLFHP